MKQFILFLLLMSSAILINGFEINGDVKTWQQEDFIGFDQIGDCTFSTGDIASLFWHCEDQTIFIRITFNDMASRNNNLEDLFTSDISLSLKITQEDTELLHQENLPIYKVSMETKDYRILRNVEQNLLEMRFPLSLSNSKNCEIRVDVYHEQNIIDNFTSMLNTKYRGGNCAFVHHGNQGLTYTEVFYGQYPQESSGFDEVLEVHEQYNIPGNFHMSGTLMPAAEWHNPEFNDWLQNGVQSGYVSMLSSALGQHIMPFVQNNMNNWSVAIETDMVNYRYNYQPKVAWVPERVWLAPGHYPEAGVIDWLGDNWTQHGIEAVILDDAPHCDTGSNTKIHWMNNGSGVNLRVIPINNEFVGYMHYDVDAAKNLINSTGQYGIAVYGTDWEVAAEMNEHHDSFFLDNYQNVLGYCADNYPAINVWKLDSALSNSDFDGNGIEVTTGTYFLLGGYEGYGYANNSWYTHWASSPSHSDFHDPVWSYGYIWNDAYENLMSSPDNDLSQLGWYTLMINLHETGWHDNGDISGWEHRYSAHMKNANVYAEASRWANNEYETEMATYWHDIDRDGIDELIMHNSKIFIVFETIGGRACWAFCKDGNGAMYSVIGSDVAYWSESDGDYNESSNNHFGALSDVSPNYQHEIYDVDIIENSETHLEVSFSKNEINKTCVLSADQSYLEVLFSSDSGNIYNKSGWSPDLLDIIWSGKSNIQRMWGENGNYAGRRNSSSGATVAYVLGDAGANHQGEFQGTLVMGDEIVGNGQFKIYLYTGITSEPYDENFNRVTELDVAAALLSDDISPEIVNNEAYIVGDNKIQLTFNESVTEETATNIDNYSLNLQHENEVSTILYTHQRKVILVLQENVAENESGSIIINNISDLNGNSIMTGSEANLTEVVFPHLVGSFNDWQPDNLEYEFVLNSNGLWELQSNFSPGTYQYKVLETLNWDFSYPENNQTINLDNAETITFYANSGVLLENTNGDEFVFHSSEVPKPVGNFLSEMGGIDWNVETHLTDMNDEGLNGDAFEDDGVFSIKCTIPSGNYEFKIVLNSNWDQNTSVENQIFTLSSNSEVTFFYDMVDNRSEISIQTGNSESSIPVLSSVRVKSIYPNPFNPTTNIKFHLSKSQKINVTVYNIKGQIVRTLVNDCLQKGDHTILWNGKNEEQNTIASGIYTIHFRTADAKISKKVILMK